MGFHFKLQVVRLGDSRTPVPPLLASPDLVPRMPCRSARAEGRSEVSNSSCHGAERGDLVPLGNGREVMVCAQHRLSRIRMGFECPAPRHGRFRYKDHGSMLSVMMLHSW